MFLMRGTAGPYLIQKEETAEKSHGSRNKGLNEGRQWAQSEDAQRELLCELDVEQNKEVGTQVQRLCGHQPRELLTEIEYF